MSIDPRDPQLHTRLLGRPCGSVLRQSDREAFAAQRVLITGAGGSVGSELARELAACRPDRLILFDQSEYNLFQLERELTATWPRLAVDAILGDVSRRRAIRAACRRTRPDVVYHAAAYKHVTMAERAVCPALETNVFGTLNAVEAAAEAGARFVLVSSDKAADAQSVMGATKRMAELVAVAAGGGRLRPIVVRFGNVIGSSGSVLEIMVEHIRARRPMPITHPDATRYFMSGPEAASLVMCADLIGLSGETYWLEMGEPIRIGDLATRLMDLAVVAGYERMPVEVTGLRPGEKLCEELTSQGFTMARTARSRIWSARQAPVDAVQVGGLLHGLWSAIMRHDAVSALDRLALALPEFRPSDHAWEQAALASDPAVFQAPAFRGARRSRRAAAAPAMVH